MDQFIEAKFDLPTNSAEYVFLYKVYDGKLYRHIDPDYPFFKSAWDIIQQTEALETIIKENSPIIEQIYEVGGIRYHCLWTHVKNNIDTINGPPDVITWTVQMVAPTHIQGSLF